jgi:hypothetical protein
MHNPQRFTKAQLIEFYERLEKDNQKVKEQLWETQRELHNLKTAGSETLDTARGKVLDVIQPLAMENSEALLYFWRRLEIERDFGSLTAETFTLLKDVWEQSEADEAAIKLESMST